VTVAALDSGEPVSTFNNPRNDYLTTPDCRDVTTPPEFATQVF